MIKDRGSFGEANGDDNKVQQELIIERITIIFNKFPTFVCIRRQDRGNKIRSNAVTEPRTGPDMFYAVLINSVNFGGTSSHHVRIFIANYANQNSPPQKCDRIR